MPKATRKSQIVRRQSKYGRPLTAREKRELAHRRAPRRPDRHLRHPRTPAKRLERRLRGKFYRPVKRAVSMRLDADIIAWLKRPGKGYQTRANKILRQRMLQESKHP
jgi:uncharacterized protein (DUF4415 family)